MTKKIILLKVLLGLWISLVLVACTTKEYPYHKGVTNYLNTEHNIDIENCENQIFYFLPINECTSCQETTLNIEMLKKIKKYHNLTIVIIDLNDDSKFNSDIENVNNRLLFDQKSSIYKYPTGVAKPLLLHIKKGKIIYSLQVDDPKLKTAKDYIQKYAK